MATAPSTIRDLRRLWKPHKLRLLEADPKHPTTIRFHRACSWIQRAELLGDGEDQEFTLVSYWVAFNALYGQWDSDRQEPLADRMSWKQFLDRMLNLDENQILGNCLKENRSLVMMILEDAYLSRYFWKEPTPKRAGQSRKVKFDAQTWYLQSSWHLMLERVVERIYLLRCQLVHGASSYNSSLNRDAMSHCSRMMKDLLRGILEIWIQNGADEDWGTMCYPPLPAHQQR